VLVALAIGLPMLAHHYALLFRSQVCDQCFVVRLATH